MNTVFDGEATDPGNYMAVLPISGLFIFQADRIMEDPVRCPALHSSLSIHLVVVPTQC